MIYLDNAATTFPKPKVVLDTFEYWQKECCVNAGRGSYKKATEASDVIVSTRKEIAEYVGAIKYEDVVFTDSATLAANIVLQGLVLDAGDVIYVTPYEHNAIMRTVEGLRLKKGVQLQVLPVDETKRMDISSTIEMFKEKPPKVICVTQVSNVTGYYLPYRELFEEAKKYNAITVLDSAQGLGLFPVHVVEDKIDFLIFAGHKNLYGTFGVGGFVNTNDISLELLLYGGNGSDSLNLGMPEKSVQRFEIGSPNLTSIAALREGIRYVRKNQKELILKEQKLLRKLQDGLKNIPGIKIFSAEIDDKEKSGILSFACERYSSEELGMILDEDFDIAVRTGYHCAPLVHDVIESKEYGGTVRVGVSMFTTENDVDALVEAVKELMEE